MQATGEIVGISLPGPLESREWRYEWRGGEVVELNYLCWTHMLGRRDEPRPGQVLTIGQFRLRVISYDFMTMSCLVMRDGWKARGYEWLCRATPWARSCYHRLVLTAAVWGLARYHPDMVPSWRDLYIVRWWQRRKGQQG